MDFAENMPIFFIKKTIKSIWLMELFNQQYLIWHALQVTYSALQL